MLCFLRFWLLGGPRADVRQTRVRTTVLQKTHPHSSLTHISSRGASSQNLGKHSIWLRGGRSKSESHSSLAAALPDRTRQTLRTKRFRASGAPNLEKYSISLARRRQATRERARQKNYWNYFFKKIIKIISIILEIMIIHRIIEIILIIFQSWAAPLAEIIPEQV